MKSHFRVDGNMLRPFDPKSIISIDQLEAAVYNIGADPMGYFLQKIEPFTIPSRVYGNTSKHAERIMSTFESRTGRGTGVLLTGEKGSGKTMLTKVIANMAMAKTMPVLVANAPFCGDGFNRFIQSITQPAVVLFDEFEKTYDREDQSKLLTLLDGTFSTQKLFLLTCNDRWRIDDYMRNRPGRLFYSLNFSRLEDTFVKDYCEDNLTNKAHLESVYSVANMFSSFNFDMLKALIEEMNRYDETAVQAVAMLNIKPEMEADVRFDAVLRYKGQPLADALPHKGAARMNPLNPNFESYPTITVDTTNWTPEMRTIMTDELGAAPGPDRVSFHINHSMLHAVNGTAGEYIFELPNYNGFQIVFTRQEPSATAQFSYY